MSVTAPVKNTEHREEPMDLRESLFYRSVASGEAKGKEIEGFEAKKEPFLSLEKEGWRKHIVVLRSGPPEPETPAQPAGKKRKKKKKKALPWGRLTVIHYWEHPVTKERCHLKFKSNSPWVSRLER